MGGYLAKSGSSRTTPSSDIPKHSTDTLGEAGPALLFDRQLSAPLRRDRVEASFTVLFSQAPLRLQPALLFHPMKCRIERAFLAPQEFCRDALHVRRDCIAVHPLVRREGLEDQQGQCALKNVVFRCAHERSTKA